MYLFTRRAQIGTKRAEALQWAVTITEKINQISQTPVSLYSTILSPEVGTLSWSTVIENLSELEANDAKLMADSGYLDLVSQATKYQAPGGILDDSVASFVLADRSESGSPGYATVVRATLASGALASGIETGVESRNKPRPSAGCPCHSSPGAYRHVRQRGVDHQRQLDRRFAGVIGEGEQRCGLHQVARHQGQQGVPAWLRHAGHPPQDRLIEQHPCRQWAGPGIPGPALRALLDVAGPRHN